MKNPCAPMEITDVFDVLKKRHACRNFDPKPVPDEILQRLALAAHRAPTGGNVPYRFVIVVQDFILAARVVCLCLRCL